MTGELFSLDVGEDDDGERLDRFLARSLDGRTRSTVQRWIQQGHVSVDDGAATKPGLALKTGMRVELREPGDRPSSIRPEEIPLEIVHEDEDLVVVDKPAGMVVHQGHGRMEGTLVNALLGRGTPLAQAGGPDRPGIVHRLDLDTSGLIVVAKSDAAYHGFARALAAREVLKRYRALVWGAPDPPTGSIDRPIGRSRGQPTKMAVRGMRGRSRHALTEYTTIERLPGFALLDVNLRTGRTHQIRVHMQSVHHPVVGDERYGGCPWRGVQDPAKRKALREFERLALHAASLAFTHPVTGQPLKLSAALPPSFERLLDTLRTR
ncbi:MAG: RluA family pseudouridine synthase [bacterium]|nr:RluA family pseudouridine synthase [bacterium]